MCSATVVVKAMTSCLTSASISLMRSTVKSPLVANDVGGVLGDEAELCEGLGGGDFYGEPAAVFVLVGPDAAHRGASVAGDQSEALLDAARGSS